MEKEACVNCRFFVPDAEQPHCSVPIWMGAELFKTHYTRPESKCAMYEPQKAEERQEP